ncbi:phosphatidylserine decarboxylase [Salinisphaera hydrothermalis]|uniref:Phosphatidylserine decarboxylase n=1 Tax=Salinisphaera hydrothermalis (strain C41B8) TaxID=1304275 RepID=A0A084IME6_SALHC|nr:phosphatidylserine decarboxylase [Salinisphaera hydrothermalis]KEZ77880.1 phosphatidylserine decarboxylase [Salinisphaera hydrothermalis C41B8]
MILAAQLVVLGVLVVALMLLRRHWPYPSPLIRPFLPPQRRWPEAQIRGWLRTKRFHPGYLAFFDRDPERIVPSGPALLAPADGLVTSVDCRDGIRYIVIALSFWDMHVQRSPATGRVVSVERLGATYTDGEGRDFAFLRDKYCPVQARTLFECNAGRVAVRQITSVAARRIETWVVPGQPVERGQRMGRIRLGSTVVLEADASLACRVAVGERVRAGETALLEVSEVAC